MKILLIDDHPIFTEGLKFSLESTSAQTQCHIVTDSELALKHLDEDCDYDLILLDLNMPTMDGITFLQATTNKNILIPIAVLSATEDVKLINEAFERGALGFIPKSFSKQELMVAIDAILAGNLFVPVQLERQLARAKKNIHSDDRIKQLGITDRQAQVLALLAKGQTNNQIAETLFISNHTVKFHVNALFQVLGVSSRTDCVIKVQELKLI